MTTAIYLRKSRAEESDLTQSDTLQRHKDTLLAFAENHGLHIAGIYEEVVSGESLYTRPEMLKLLSDAEAGKYDAVLVMDIDRLGRGAMSDQGIILETLKLSGTKIITPRKTYDLNNELDEEYTEFETFIARRELKLIKRRMQRGVAKSIEEGAYIANAPYGYTKTKSGKRPTLEICEHEAQFVRLIFDLYVNEGCGAQAIADRINQMGAVPRRSASFSRSSVLGIIRNHVYIGKIVWNKTKHLRKGTKSNSRHVVLANPKSEWTVADGIHPPIIGEEIFRQAQAILQGRYHPPKNNGTLHNPMSGLIYCAKCGRLMVRRKYASFGGRERCVNFICPTKGCTPYERLQNVEEGLLNALKGQFHEIRTDSAPPKKEKKKSNQQNVIEIIARETAAVQKQLDKLHDLLEQGVYSTDTFLSRSKLLGDKLKKLEQSKAEAIDCKPDSENPSGRIPLLETLLDSYWGSDPQTKNEMLKSVLAYAVYTKEHGSALGDFDIQLYLK